MQQHEQVEFIRQIGQFVIDQVTHAVRPLHEKIVRLEKEITEYRAHVIEPNIIADVIDARFASLKLPEAVPGPPGRDGKDGVDGKDVEIEVVKDWVVGHVFKYFEDTPPKNGIDGKDGKDGTDGIDGIDGKSVSLDEVRGAIDASVAAAIAKLPIPVHVVSGFIDRRGYLFHVFSDGSQLEFGKVAANEIDKDDLRDWVRQELALWPKPENGKDGKDGVDGFSLSDFELIFDGERTLTAAFVSGELRKEFKFVLSNPLYQGTWREGEYQRGECVNYDGSGWIALANTQTKPGTPNSDWQLFVKRGRDGKSITGPPGPPGTPGRDGKDLTQMGFDGRKW